MNQILAGAVAGTIATIPMTVVMAVLHRYLPGEPPRALPPREVVEAAAVRAGAGRELSERDVRQLTWGAHFGYGALTGALLGVVAPARPGTGTAAATGAAFGFGVWAASYLGWLPAVGLRQSPRYDPLARSGLMISAHVVWGAAAGLMLGRRGRTTGANLATAPGPH